MYVVLNFFICLRLFAQYNDTSCVRLTDYGAGGFGVLPGGGMKKKKKKKLQHSRDNNLLITYHLICQVYVTQLELEWDREQENQENQEKVLNTLFLKESSLT